MKDISRFSVKSLKKLIARAGLSIDGVFEKPDLLELAKQAQRKLEGNGKKGNKSVANTKAKPKKSAKAAWAGLSNKVDLTTEGNSGRRGMKNQNQKKRNNKPPAREKRGGRGGGRGRDNTSDSRRGGRVGGRGRGRGSGRRGRPRDRMDDGPPPKRRRNNDDNWKNREVVTWDDLSLSGGDPFSNSGDSRRGRDRGRGGRDRGGRERGGHSFEWEDRDRPSGRRGRDDDWGGNDRVRQAWHRRGGGGDNYEEREMTPELEPVVMRPAKANRLFIGGLWDHNDDKARQLVEDITGENSIKDIFVIENKHICFVTMKTVDDAMKVKEELDGKRIGRNNLYVRQASHKAMIWVGELSPAVSNEHLYRAFKRFGPVERAIVVADDKGVSLGHGFVQFEQKRSAGAAVQECRQRLFMLTQNGPPVRVAPYICHDIHDGVVEKFIPKRLSRDLCKPYYPTPGGVSHEFGMRFRKLREMYEAEKQVLREKYVQMEKEVYSDQRSAEDQEVMMRREEEQRLFELQQQQELDRQRMIAEMRQIRMDRIRGDLKRQHEFERMGREPVGGDPFMRRQGDAWAMPPGRREEPAPRSEYGGGFQDGRGPPRGNPADQWSQPRGDADLPAALGGPRNPNYDGPLGPGREQGLSNSSPFSNGRDDRPGGIPPTRSGFKSGAASGYKNRRWA